MPSVPSSKSVIVSPTTPSAVGLKTDGGVEDQQTSAPARKARRVSWRRPVGDPRQPVAQDPERAGLGQRGLYGQERGGGLGGDGSLRA